MPARRLLMRKIRATRRKIVLGGMVVAARVWKLNVGGLDWPMVTTARPPCTSRVRSW